MSKYTSRILQICNFSRKTFKVILESEPKISETLSLIVQFSHRRYEVESDENRRAIAIEIGHDYLGIENNNSNHKDSKEKIELNSLEHNNVESTTNSQTNEGDEEQSLTENNLVIDILNDELVSLVRQKILSENSNSTFFLTFCDIISIFKDYPRELFEACFHAVKNYLAGEPFREFEASMFFHR